MRPYWESLSIPPKKALPSLLALVGPTASGKTSVACELAKHLPLETISCDSMQVYKRMPILTQAPTAREKKILKAHLTGFLDPSKEYNAAAFRRDATAAIAKIVKKDQLPLVTGGTGLYLRALLDGLFEHAKDEGRNEVLRKKLLQEQEKHGGNYLHEKLTKIDPVSAARIHPNDFRRLIRALEVCQVTGQLFSAQRPQRKGLRERFTCRVFLLERDRADLYERIEKRVDAMVDEGLLKEVKRLSSAKIGRTASMALGYREMLSVLKKESDLAAAVDLLKKNTRHYAKRQLSWFRHEKAIELVPVARGEKPKDTAKKILYALGDTRLLKGECPPRGRS